MTTVLGPIPRATAVETCADLIENMIVSGAIATGAQLPPERSLAARLAVNRATLRGALARLAQRGLVSARQGSGYAIRDYLRTGGLELLATVLSRAATRTERRALAADLLALRRAIARLVLERVVACVAAEATEGRALVLASWNDAVDELARRVDEGAPVAEIARADLDVAHALVALTGSTVFQLALNPVAHILASSPSLQNAMFRSPDENVRAWRLLSTALASATPARDDDDVPPGDERASLPALFDTILAERDAATLRALESVRLDRTP